MLLSIRKESTNENDLTIYCEYCEIFAKSFFYRTPPVDLSVDLFFLIKNNVGWFLLRFLDLIIVRYLHIISRNYSNTLLLINLRKTQTCPK